MIETAAEPTIVYTDDEIRGYLPPGWNLAGPAAGLWDAGKRRWTVRVEDTADVRWDLPVDERDVEEKGRLEALRLAVHRLNTDRLGRRTRGLGF